MHRISEIIGKPIVSAETGDRFGRVSDALLADGEVGVVGLVVSDGLFATEHVLALRDIQTLGGDTVLVRPQTEMLDAAEWRQSGVKSTRCSAVRGKPVVTASGRRLGQVSDVLINEQTGGSGAIEVTAHDLAGLRTRRSIVRGSEEIRIGPDTVVVPDAAIEDPPAADSRAARGQEAS